MLITFALAMTSVPQLPLDYQKRGIEIVEQIRRDYYLPASRLYAEDIGIDGEKSGPCFNWGTGVLLSALNAAAKVEPKYRKWLREYADASRSYWNTKPPVAGYDVLPGPKDVDRYYDDNAWMVLALVETYEILGDKKYLDWAEEALEYVLSGEDGNLGGGIYWRESDKASKNACSNAPSAAACLAVAKYRQSARLQKKAEDLLRWTQANLQDPADGLIWDNIALSGKIEKTKWTYNTGLYLKGWKMLDGVTPIEAVNLKRVFESSINYWLDPKTGAAKDGGRFVHLWFEGLLSVEPKDSQLRDRLVKALKFADEHARTPDGRFADRWDRPIGKDKKRFALIDQASAARAFLVVGRP